VADLMPLISRKVFAMISASSARSGHLREAAPQGTTGAGASSLCAVCLFFLKICETHVCEHRIFY
jgi:hypothetical protein